MKKKHIKTFADINASIPKEMTARLMIKRNKYEQQKKVALLALEDPNFPEEKKEAIKNLLTAGHLDVEEEVESEEVQKEIYEYIKNEIIKKVEEGVLPKYMLKELTKAIKKTK